MVLGILGLASLCLTPATIGGTEDSRAYGLVSYLSRLWYRGF